jgi:hypothetical protein
VHSHLAIPPLDFWLSSTSLSYLHCHHLFCPSIYVSQCASLGFIIISRFIKASRRRLRGGSLFLQVGCSGWVGGKWNWPFLSWPWLTGVASVCFGSIWRSGNLDHCVACWDLGVSPIMENSLVVDVLGDSSGSCMFWMLVTVHRLGRWPSLLHRKHTGVSEVR